MYDRLGLHRERDLIRFRVDVKHAVRVFLNLQVQLARAHHVVALEGVDRVVVRLRFRFFVGRDCLRSGDGYRIAGYLLYSGVERPVLDRLANGRLEYALEVVEDLVLYVRIERQQAVEEPADIAEPIDRYESGARIRLEHPHLGENCPARHIYAWHVLVVQQRIAECRHRGDALRAEVVGLVHSFRARRFGGPARERSQCRQPARDRRGESFLAREVRRQHDVLGRLLLVGAVRAAKHLHGLVSAPAWLQRDVIPNALVLRLQVGLQADAGTGRARQYRDALLVALECGHLRVIDVLRLEAAAALHELAL